MVRMRENTVDWSDRTMTESVLLTRRARMDEFRDHSYGYAMAWKMFFEKMIRACRAMMSKLGVVDSREGFLRR